MTEIVSKLKCMLLYHDSDPVEFLSGLIKSFLPLMLGANVCTVSLSLTGLMSIWTSLFGDLSARNLSNLISFTVPLTLLVVDVAKGLDHGIAVQLTMMIVSVWCLIRTTFERNNKAWSKK